MALNPLIKAYLKEFCKTFLLLTLSLSTLFAIVGLIEKIHDYIPFNPPITFFLKFILYSLPRYFFYLIPFVTLIATLYVFSMGVRNRELLVVSLAGGKLRRILVPFTVLSLLISISGFFFGEFLQPEFTKKLNRMVSELTEKGGSVQRSNLFLRAKDGTIVKIGQLIYSEGTVQGSTGRAVKIFILKDNALKERIDAEEAKIEREFWILKNVVHYQYGTARVERKDSYRIALDIEISSATLKDIRKLEEFGIMELIQKREELKRMGLSNPKIDADISGRLSNSFVTLFMTILGISIPLGASERLIAFLTKTKGEKAKGGALVVGVGFLIMILYWLIYSLFMFFGYSKILPPLLAPWITPVIFGVLSVKLWLSIKE